MLGLICARKEHERRSPTLVVMPKALLGQWASEVARHCVGLECVVYHGADRTGDPNVLRAVDVVSRLPTIPVLACFPVSAFPVKVLAVASSLRRCRCRPSVQAARGCGRRC